MTERHREALTKRELEKQLRDTGMPKSLAVKRVSNMSQARRWQALSWRRRLRVALST